MAEKTLKTRIQIKGDTAENWAKATNFIPLKNEPILYTDLGKIKYGDGVTNVNSLPFAFADILPISESDNGKFLRVVDGAPAWQKVDSAEEVSI